MSLLSEAMPSASTARLWISEAAIMAFTRSCVSVIGLLNGGWLSAPEYGCDCDDQEASDGHQNCSGGVHESDSTLAFPSTTQLGARRQYQRYPCGATKRRPLSDLAGRLRADADRGIISDVDQLAR